MVTAATAPLPALLDREAAARGGTDAERAAIATEVDALKRWCAAFLHHPDTHDCRQRH